MEGEPFWHPATDPERKEREREAQIRGREGGREGGCKRRKTLYVNFTSVLSSCSLRECFSEERASRVVCF